MPPTARRAFLLTAAASLLLPGAAIAQAKPKLGFIGAGRIGGQLARFWADAGYPVMLSSLDIEAMRELAADIGHGVRAGTPREAARFGQVVVVSVPYHALPQIGRDHAEELKGKIVLDTCNPNPERDGAMSREALRKGTGVMDPIYLPGTRLVRAFNTIGYGALAPMAHRAGERIGVPIAGDDKQGVRIVSRLVHDAGFEPVLVGGLVKAKRFDPGTAVYDRTLPASELRDLLHLK